MIRLSKRLAAAASYVIAGETAADIGTDHALLPVALVQRGIVPRAVAADVREGPAQAAQRQVSSAGLADRIDVRIGDGLSVLAPGEAGTVVIAGMGGGTIRDILERAGKALEGVRRLVLQPNTGERLVREWLAERDWKLAAETLLEEDGVYYEVLAADRAVSAGEAVEWNRELYAPVPDSPVSTSAKLAMGPYLMREAGPLFFAKWEANLTKLERLLAKIGRSSQPEAMRRYSELAGERNEIREVLTWLSK